jgi:hypothetical protein
MCLCPDMLSQENTVSTPTLNFHSEYILNILTAKSPPEIFTAAASFYEY